MSERIRGSNNGASRPTRVATAGLSSSSSGATSAAAASTANPNGRPNNLFRSHFMRRPTGGASNSTESMRLESEARLLQKQQQQQQQQQQMAEDTSEIVVRGENGEIEIENPPTPVVDDEEELQAQEYRMESEREKQRLADAIKHHQISHSSMGDHPDALLEAVRESLRTKVTALADDNWMFEPEEQPRGG